MYFETWFKADLRHAPQLQTLHGLTFTGDDKGSRVGVIVTDDGEAATLSGAVLGYAIRPDGNTVVITGARADNRAWVDLPEAALAYPGQIQLVIRLVDGEEKATLCAVAAGVLRTVSGDPVDPGEVVPDLEELLARIDDMQRGTAAANQAASAANTAASNADAKAALADQKATLANTAAAGANQAADQAAGAAYNADQKAALADQKATLADQKATLANTAAEAANLAADAANDAAEAATDAAAAANTAAQQALLVDNDGLFYVNVEEE